MAVTGNEPKERMHFIQTAFLAIILAGCAENVAGAGQYDSAGSGIPEVQCGDHYPPHFAETAENCPSIVDKDEPAPGYRPCVYAPEALPYLVRYYYKSDTCPYEAYGSIDPPGFVPCDYSNVHIYVEEEQFCPNPSDGDLLPVGYDLCRGEGKKSAEFESDPETWFYAPSHMECTTPTEKGIYTEDAEDVADDRYNLFDATGPEKLAAASTAVLVRKESVVTDPTNPDHFNLRTRDDAPNLCKSARFSRESMPGFCSGFKIGDRLVATAGHCIIDQSDCDNTRIVFGFQMLSDDSRPDQVVPAARIYSCQRIVGRVMQPEKRRGADWAIVSVGRAIVAPTLELRPPGDSHPIEKFGKVTVIGYPSGLPVKLLATAP